MTKRVNSNQASIHASILNDTQLTGHNQRWDAEMKNKKKSININISFFKYHCKFPFNFRLSLQNTNTCPLFQNTPVPREELGWFIDKWCRDQTSVYEGQMQELL